MTTHTKQPCTRFAGEVVDSMRSFFNKLHVATPVPDAWRWYLIDVYDYPRKTSACKIKNNKKSRLVSNQFNLPFFITRKIWFL